MADIDTPNVDTPNTDAPAADTNTALGGVTNDAPTGDNGTDANQTDQNAGAAEGAPESYESFSLPEGMSLDEGNQTKFSEWAKTNNLTQAKAQELVTMASEMGMTNANSATEAVDAYKSEQESSVTEMRTQWRDEIKTDPEFGGQNYNETLERAKGVLRKFGDAEKLGPLLNVGGLGDHPEVIKIFARIGKAMGEDKLVTGDASKDTPVALANQMFPNHK